MDNLPDDISLNLLGVSEGTDKTFIANDYLRHYSRIFEPFRHAEINVLEIGVLGGASLRTWQKYFTRATIIGVDIEPHCIAHAGERMIVEIGSQADEAFLKMISEKYNPTIIIDDGSHNSDHQIITLECLFPRLPEGGVYVIEDLFFHANPACAAQFTGTGPILAIDYLLAAARDRAAWPSADPSAHRRQSLIGWPLDRIEFFNGCVALFRKKEILTPHDMLALAYDAVGDSTAQYVWDRIYDYATRYKDQADVAEQAAKNAYKASANEFWYRSRMIRVRQMQGRLDEAIAEAKRGVELSKGGHLEAEFQAKLDELVTLTSGAN